MNDNAHEGDLVTLADGTKGRWYATMPDGTRKIGVNRADFERITRGQNDNSNL